MIKTTFYKDSNNRYVGFTVKGHAGYANSGKDIVCAGVSVLTINTINSVKAFTDNTFKTHIDEAGTIKFKFDKESDDKGQLLIQSMELGILGIIEDYGKKYVEVHYKEV